MTDTQMLTLVLAIASLSAAVLVPLSLLIYSNSRVTDLRDTLKLSLSDTRDTLKNSLIDLKEVLRAEMQRNQSELLTKLAEMETRLSHLETERRIRP